MRRLMAMLSAAGVLVAISAPALGSSGPSVGVQGYKFTPKVVHIKKGQTITWKWKSTNDDLHNVTFKGFHSKSQKTGRFTHTFSKAGTYTYVCTFHVHSHGMRGTVIVG